MTLSHLLVYLLVAFLCGMVGQAIAGRSVGGFLVTTFLGLIGGMVGGWIARVLHLPEPLWIYVGGRPFGLVWTVIGAAVIAFMVSWFIRRKM